MLVRLFDSPSTKRNDPVAPVTSLLSTRTCVRVPEHPPPLQNQIVNCPAPFCTRLNPDIRYRLVMVPDQTGMSKINPLLTIVQPCTVAQIIVTPLEFCKWTGPEPVQL